MEELTMIQDEQGTWKVTLPEPEKEAHLEAERAGMLGGLVKTEVFGIPIGAAGGALVTAGIWDMLAGVVKGMVPGVPNWVVPAAGAFAVNTKMVRGFVGTGAANAAGIILAADAIQQFFNLRGLISGLIKPTAAMGQSTGALHQAETVATNYYGRALGR